MLAIIPARDGSKGLKHKNIKRLDDKPLMAYSIEAAISSKCFENVMVSTNSEYYKEVALQYGAEVPFLRSEQNSKDDVSSWVVVKEVLENYKKIGKDFKDIVLLQPTSPLRTKDDILGAKNLYITKKASLVASISAVEYLPFLANTLDENLCLKDFIKKEYLLPRQAFPPYYRLNGAIYIIKKSHLKSENLYDENAYGFIMDRENSMDIDTEEDFFICEQLLKKRK